MLISPSSPFEGPLTAYHARRSFSPLPLVPIQQRFLGSPPLTSRYFFADRSQVIVPGIPPRSLDSRVQSFFTPLSGFAPIRAPGPSNQAVPFTPRSLERVRFK